MTNPSHEPSKRSTAAGERLLSSVSIGSVLAGFIILAGMVWYQHTHSLTRVAAIRYSHPPACLTISPPIASNPS
jgi:hypothetical protein